MGYEIYASAISGRSGIMALKLCSFFRGNMFGLVDYEDEEDDIPMNLGSNGKDGGEVFEKESDSLLTSIPLSDPIWSNLEDGAIAKRKSSPAPDLEPDDAVVSKRQKPGKSQATERSNDLRTLTSIDDSDESAASVRGAEVPESAELTNKCSQGPNSPEGPASLSDNSKIFPYEEPKLPGNGAVVDWQTLDPDLHPVTKSNQVDGGDSGAETAGESANGKVNMLPQSVDCSSMVANNLGRTANGSASALAEKTNGLEGEVSTPSERHEDPNLPNGTSSLARSADGNGVENPVNPDDTLLSVPAEGCASGNGLGGCNGTANDGVKREDYGTGSIKCGVAQELSNGSLESENKKLTSLGSDLLRAVTPTSPGPFTVR